MNTPSERAGWSRAAETLDVLTELVALVRGECPRLLNEDSGGNAPLALRIEAIMALAPPSSLEGNQGVMAERCDGTDTAAPTSPSSAGSVAGQGGGSRA